MATPYVLANLTGDTCHCDVTTKRDVTNAIGCVSLTKQTINAEVS